MTDPFDSVKLDDGRIWCRVRIIGTYKGKPFDYTDPPGRHGSQFIFPDGDPSYYWWYEGNMACDCNRCRFVGIEEMDCGDTIHITSINPIDPSLPALVLNETEPCQTPTPT